MFTPMMYVVVGMIVLLGYYRIEKNRIEKSRAYKGYSRLPMYCATNKRGGGKIVV